MKVNGDVECRDGENKRENKLGLRSAKLRFSSKLQLALIAEPFNYYLLHTVQLFIWACFPLCSIYWGWWVGKWGWRTGVNIFQNKWIFHPGKVSHFGPFREEFPYSEIRARCRKSSFQGSEPIPFREPSPPEGNLSLTRIPSLGRKPFPDRETLHRDGHLSLIFESLQSMPGKSFPAMEMFPCQEKVSLPGKGFPVREGFLIQGKETGNRKGNRETLFYWEFVRLKFVENLRAIFREEFSPKKSPSGKSFQ